MFLEIALMLLLVGLNGLFAMSELVVISSRPARLRLRAARGDRGAGIALNLTEDPGRFLSTVQIGIKLVGVLAGAFSGSTIGVRLAAVLPDFGVPERVADEVGVGLVGYRVIVFGPGRFGTAIGMRLQKRGIRVLGVDFNPLAVRRWRDLGLDTEFGDATDPEFVGELSLSRAAWVVSTVPIHPAGLSHKDTRTTHIQLTRAAGFRGRVVAASHHSKDTEELFGAGVDICPRTVPGRGRPSSRIALRRAGRSPHRHPVDRDGREAPALNARSNE